MKKALKIIIPILLILMILGGAVWYFLVYNRPLTWNFLLERADHAAESGRFGRAVRYYSWAYDLADKDPEIAIRLADAYRDVGNYTKAEYTLVNAISRNARTDLYVALSRVYVEQDKLLDAVTMLDQVANPEIRTELDGMRPSAPEAKPDPGFYNKYIGVTLQAGGETICYSTSREYPSTAGPVYDKPLTLSQGETTIQAVAVGENGLVSSLTVFGYTVGGVVEPVTLQDAGLDAQVRELLGLDENDEILTSDLWGITELDAGEAVQSLADLTYFTKLTRLSVHNLAEPDLSFLSTSTELLSLDLSGCSLSTEDLERIGALQHLAELNLSGCGVSNISGLSAAKKLTSLNLSDNSINNISALSGLTALQELQLQHNALTELSSLAPLAELRTLDVSYNALTDIAPVTACLKLETLDVSENKLTELASIQKLSSLKKLAASNNDLTSLGKLGECTALTNLDVSNNALTEIDAVGSLAALEELDISYNEVTAIPQLSEGAKLARFQASHNAIEDVENLAVLEELNYVNIDYNSVKDISCLASCYRLVQVDAFGNDISDVSALTEKSIIVNYDPT